MRIALLFAGQGVQHVGMGSSFLAKNEFNEIFNLLSEDQKRLSLEGPLEILSETKNAQPCIVATSLGIANILKKYNLNIEYVAGLSLGEYSALAYSNVLSVEDILKIVAKRGEIMSNALSNTNTGMLAVLNAGIDLLESVICKYENVQIANYNSPRQIVLTGKISELDEVSEELKNLKIRSIKLNVSGAFHSKYLENASTELKAILEQYQFNEQKIPIVFNTLAEISNEDIKLLLSNQIKSSVKWMQSIEYMIQQGIDTFIEIGPGKVLSGFVAQINKEVKIYTIENLEQLESMVKEIYE